MVRYADLCEEGVEFFVLPTLVYLESKNFAIELPFNEILKVMKFLENFRLLFNEIDPDELAKIIYKTYIEFLSSYCFNSRTPNIKEDKL